MNAGTRRVLSPKFGKRHIWISSASPEAFGRSLPRVLAASLSVSGMSARLLARAYGRLLRTAELSRGRRGVAIEGALTVGAGGGGGAVGVEDELPAPPVDRHEMVEGADQAAVFDAGGAPFGAGDQVVDVAGGR